MFYNFDANFLEMINFSLFYEFIKTDPMKNYNAVLWVMGYLLLGSLLIYSFLAIFGNINRRFILYIILVVLFHKTVYLAFILGMILSDSDVNDILPKFNKITIYIILFIGIYFASFKTYSFTFYSILNISFINDYFRGFLTNFYNIIGASLLLLAISRLSVFKKVFSTRILQYLGKISFPIYLLHFIIICSLSSYVYIFLTDRNNDSPFILTSIITLIVTIIFSHIFHIVIELRSINLSKTLYNFIIK